MAALDFQEPIYPPLSWELPERRSPGLPERERFPVDPVRWRLSSEALHALRSKHPERIAGRSFSWRAKLYPATGLPASLRTWVDAPFSLDDEKAQSEAHRVLTASQLFLALFGAANEDNLANGFDPAPIIKVQTNPGQNGGAVMRHFSWRQIHRDVSVLGGSVRVHDVTGDRRVCVTSSYFPVSDAPPDMEKYISAVDCMWFALLSLLETRAISPEAILAIMVPRFFRERRGQEAANFFRVLEESFSRGNWGDGGELSWLLTEAFARWRERGEGSDVAAEELELIRGWLRMRYDGVKFRVEVAPIQGSKLAIVPWAGAYALMQRVQVTLPNHLLWYVDIDAHNGNVLGAPWQAVAGAPTYFTTSGEAAAEMPVGDAANVSTNDLAAYVTVLDGGAVQLGATSSLSASLSVDAATVVVHGQQLLQHLQNHCGASLTPPPSPLTVHARSTQYDIQVAGFIPGSPGAVHFKSTPADGAMVGGKRVFHPARDPEVVMHEFAHAFLWLMNPDPWDVPTGLAPFSRALQEGYAMYLSRSLAAKNGDNQDQRWGRGAYRSQNANGTDNWADRWRLDRPTRVAGADFLPALNAYPAGEYTLQLTLEDYDVGMVWARALWDLRTVLGPAVVDKLAVRAYPYLHGHLTSFELAAEAFINADAQVSEMDLGNGTQPVWAGRGIAAGQGICGFAETQNGTLAAAGEAGILRSDDGGASWASESANLAGGGTLTGVVAVAADGNHLIAIAELPPPTATGSDTQWNPGVYWRDLSQAGSLWQEVPNWPNDITPLCLLRVGNGRVLVGSNRGVYVLDRSGTNQFSWTPPTGTNFPALALTQVTTQGLNLVQAMSPGKLHRSILSSQGTLSATWSESDGLFDADNKTRITALAGLGSDVLVGILPPASLSGAAAVAGSRLRQLSQNWSVKSPLGNVTSAVLALAVGAGAVWAATSDDILRWQNSTLTSFGYPAPRAQVTSLAITATHLLAGTLAHGIWRRPLVGGSWQSVCSPTQPGNLSVPANGAVVLSVLLDADQPAFTFNVPGGTLAVDAVFQVGFPPALIALNNLGNYNLETGAVVFTLRNLTNTEQVFQMNRVASDQLIVT